MPFVWLNGHVTGTVSHLRPIACAFEKESKGARSIREDKTGVRGGLSCQKGRSQSGDGAREAYFREEVAGQRQRMELCLVLLVFLGSASDGLNVRTTIGVRNRPNAE